MISWLRHLIGWVISAFRSREDLILENLALRQQLLALRARRPRRRISALQKLFWIVLRRLWAGWKKPLILVTPRTVVGWHRAGFRLYWRLISRVRKPGGRKPMKLTHLLSDALETPKPLSILDLKGLGKEHWRGIDPSKHVERERASWD